MGEYFGNILTRALSRRELLKAAAFTVAATSLVSCGGDEDKPAANQPSTNQPSKLSFQTIYPNKDDKITVPQEFEHNIIIRWGDALDNGSNLDWGKIRRIGPTAEDVLRQAKSFGYNCDFVGYLKSPDGKDLLVVNHEYTNPEIMFPSYLTVQNGVTSPAQGRPTKDEVDFMLMAHGISVVEVKRNSNGSWSYVKGSSYNRRITGITKCDISGPAKGHRLMKTSQDPNGEFVYGTLNNCAAGETPWGTILTCEENFHSYFGGNRNNISIPNNTTDTNLIRNIHERYGVPGSSANYYGFHQHYGRFNINTEPNEPFRFGWVVEIDPMDPNSTPIKRTTLGRFKHEAATYAIAPDGRVVIYMGDDERFEYIYKFITKGKYNQTDRKANMNLLDEGELYVAKFDYTDKGMIGEWILIARVEKNANSYNVTVNDKLPDEFKNDPALCFINTRGAADSLGATMMDRPEDIEWNPVTKSVWVALTSNDRRSTSGTVNRYRKIADTTTPTASNTINRANPRAINYMGHVLEIIEEKGDPTATKFTYQIPILCGDPENPDYNKKLYLYGREVSPNSGVPAISAPDNFVIDKEGNVWIATDGNDSVNRLGKNDGVYVLDPINKTLKMFLSGVVGCEICGPEFSDDYKTFFCAIQHPGEVESGAQDPNAPSSRWPYGDNVEVPRPSVIAVWRKDGKEIYR
ncbi:MAG: PhoX family phosphatase [Hydrogenothermaceae bacterium]|nr:PhoX family phosphatase [Hydrogenothermaceae bacterium]